MIAAPLLLPIAAAVLTFLLRRWPRVQTGVSLGAGAALLLASSLLFRAVWAGGPIAVAVGGWPAPFGIVLVVDLLSACMVLVLSLAGLAVLLYAEGEMTRQERRLGQPALMHLLIAGACGALLTGDLFNLYVWLEVMLAASLALHAIGPGRAAMGAIVTYVVLNIVATTALLAGIGLLYGTTGALNMAALHLALAGRTAEAAVLGPAVLIFFGLAVKAGLFPLFFWLPASYHTTSVAISALFSALVTKVAVYALFRVFTLIVPVTAVPGGQTVLLSVACLTMVVGVLGAAAQDEVRRILAFHIVSQIGYMVLGLAMFSAAGLAGGLFYMLHNIVAKTNLFLTGGMAARLTGSEALGRMGGLYAARPGLSVLFLLSALAMAGIPPLSGFWAKFFLVREGLLGGFWVTAVVALSVGLLTLYSMSKIWAAAFWQEAPSGAALRARLPLVMRLPAVVFALLLVAAGVWIAPIEAVMAEAARQLLDPSAYVAAVLGEAP